MMRPHRNRLIFVAAIIVLLVLGMLLRPQVAERAAPDKNVIFTSSYQLSTVHDDDLVVVSDTIALNAGSRVSGDASLIGQNLGVAGKVDGDLTLLGETLTLLPSAEIDGDANLAGKSITIDGTIDGDLLVNGTSLLILPTARINGAVNFCGPINDQRADAAAPICAPPALDPFAQLVALRNQGFDGSGFAMQVAPVGMLMFAVIGTLVLVGTSTLAVTFFPRQVSHIEEAMRARPRSFVGVGMATYALIIGLFFALTFLLAIFPPLGFLLIPIFLIVGLLLLILSLSGLVTLAVILGDWLLRRLSRVPQPPLIAAVAGSLALALGLVLVSLLPFGFFISAALLGVVSSVGLGASLFTRVGTRPVGRTYFVQG
jgi:Polymer-forming cytoskeletal